MTFQSQLDAQNQHKINLVIQFGSVSPEYFSSYQVDSGLVVDADKIGKIKDVSINPSSIDLKTAKSVIASTTFNISDDEENFTFTAFMNSFESSLMGHYVKVWAGFITGSFDFADYVDLGVYFIKIIEKSDLNYKIQAQSQVSDMSRPTFQAKGTLKNQLNTGVTTFVVITGDDIFQDSGLLQIENEIIEYQIGDKSFALGETTFAGVIRGSKDSTEAVHKAGVEVRELFEVEENPIEILLRMILSTSGTSAYDDYYDGLGIPDTQVDVTSFEDIRDNFFAAETFRLFLGIDDTLNTLTFFEKHLLIPNNVRFTESNGKIGLAILDQSTPGADLPILDETNTRPSAKWKTTADKIVNKINVKWGWNPGKKVNENITLFENLESQNTYGVKTTTDIEMRGVQDDLNGLSILTDRMERYLARFSTPQVEVDTKNFLKLYNNSPGEKVNLVCDEIPNPGGKLGIDQELEILTRSINLVTGEVSFKLVFTSYFNIRRGLIAPAPNIASVIDQKTFTVPDAKCYAVGYVLRLWNNTLNDYYADPLNTIESIDFVTNTITMENNWVTTLTTSVRVKFCDYDDASMKQKARYAFISPNSGFFPDGEKAYQIIF